MTPETPQTRLTPPEPPDRLIATSSLVVIATVLTVGAFTYLGPVLIPVIVALFLYYIIAPVAQLLIRCRIRPWLAYITLFVGVIVLLVALAQIVYVNARAVQASFPQLRDRFLARLRDWTDNEIDQNVLNSITEAVDISARDVFQFAFNTAFSSIELAAMVSFYLLFIILNGPRVAGRLQRAFSAETAGRLISIGKALSESIQQYMKVKTTVSLALAASTGFILYMVNLQYWPLWAFTMLALNYVTYLGSIIALVFPIAMAFVQFDSWISAVGVATLLIGNRLFWIDYVEIRYSGQNLNLDPLLLLASIAYWGWFWGAVGLVLAVPMLTCVKIAMTHFERTRPWAELMSAR